jgi:hypothetical protein
LKLAMRIGTGDEVTQRESVTFFCSMKNCVVTPPMPEAWTLVNSMEP